MKCPKCDSTDFYYRLKIKSTGFEPSNSYRPLPKYEPLIGKYCRSCATWIKWIKQTNELKESLNKQLQDIEFTLEGGEITHDRMD